MNGPTIRERLSIAAKTAVGLFSPGAMSDAFGLMNGIYFSGRSEPPQRTTGAYLQAYGTMPWLHAIGDKIGSAVAMNEWVLYTAIRPSTQKAIRHVGLQRMPMATRQKEIRRLKDLGEVKPIENHILLDALANGNPVDIGLNVRKVTQIHLDLVGETFWLKQRNALNVPDGFWVLPPSWVQNTPTPSYPFYRVSFRGFQKEIPDADILWFKMTDPANPYARGVGTARSLGDELETDEYAAKMLRQFFYNRADPQFIVWPDDDKGMGADEQKRLEVGWTNRNQGYNRAFRPMFSNRKLGIHQFVQDFRKQQLSELRQYQRDTIVQVFGFPPELFGVLENSNRATIDAASYLFSRWCLCPRLEFLRAVFQERLIPEYDERLIIDYVSPVEEDRDYHLKVMQASPWAFTADEFRGAAGHEALEDEVAGGMHVIPTTISGGVSDLAELPPPSVRTDGMNPAVEDDGKDVAGTAVIRRRITLPEGKAADEEALPSLSRLAMRGEAGMHREVAKAWIAFRNGISVATIVRDQLTITGETFDALRIVTENAVTDPIEAIHERGAIFGARAAGFEIERAPSVSREKVKERARAYATSRAKNYGSAVKADAATVARETIATANERGWSVEMTARQLRDTVGLTPTQGRSANKRWIALLDEVAEEKINLATAEQRIGRYTNALIRRRALEVARTELIRAANAGQQEVWREASESGALAGYGRTWETADDDAVDPICEELDGEIVGIDEAFTGGIDHPPAHPNCRCSVRLTRE